MNEQGEHYHQKIKQHLRSSYMLTDEKIEAVIPKFLGTIKTLMGELEELAVSGRNDALSRAGHAMKGALLNLGLQDLAVKASHIEKHQESCGVEVNRERLVAELKREINKII